MTAAQHQPDDIGSATESHLELSISAQTHFIQARGSLDRSTVALLLGAVSHLYERGAHIVTVGLEFVTAVDAVAVRTLCAAQEAGPPGTNLHLSGGSTWLRSWSADEAG